jgi:hypothetical protein
VKESEVRVGPRGAGFVYLLTCPRCGFVHRRNNEVITALWEKFLATRKDRDEFYLRLRR